MKVNKLAFKIGAILLALSIGTAVIGWRVLVHMDKEHREKHPWQYAENHERIIAESMANGMLTRLRDKSGKKYYFSGGTKFQHLLTEEELVEMLSWHSSVNRDKADEQPTAGTYYHLGGSSLKTFKTIGGQKLEFELTVDTIEPGTTAEEIMARDAERSEP